VPVGWTYSPAMVELMPNVLDYVRESLGINDSLIAAPSGAGYAYPQLFPEAHKPLFGELSAQLMRQSGMDYVTVIGVTPSKESLDALTAQEDVKGVIYFCFGPAAMGYSCMHGNVDYINGKPVVGARLNMWGDGTSGDEVGPEALVEELKAMPKDAADPRSYSIVAVTPSHSYADIAKAAQLLQEAGGFELLLPEKLIETLRANTNGRRQCPLPTGPWSDQCGDLPKCWLPRDGESCILTCDTIKSGLLPHKAACDLNACSQGLSLKNSMLGSSFLCADGSTCASHSDIAV